MSRIITAALLVLSFIFSWTPTMAVDNGFALVVRSPNSQKSLCLQADQSSLLDQLKANNFGPKQDETGFIYSLLGYNGPLSSDPAAQQAFWGLWQTERLVFAQLGASQIRPQAGEYYLFNFGDGSQPSPAPSFQQICTPTPATPKPTNTQLTSPGLEAALNYLNNSFTNQPAANQDWAGLALASHQRTVSIKPTAQSSILSLSRNALSLISQNQAADSLTNKIKQGWNGSQFGDTQLVNDDIFAVLAIQAADPTWLAERPQALKTIVESQRENGSFGYSLTSAGDSDMTAAAIWALSLNKTSYANQLARASQYLAGTHNSDGGYGYQSGQPSNIASTAWAMMAEAALGHETSSERSYLNAQQLPNGSWPNAGQENYLNTAYATFALSGFWLPVKTNPTQPEPNPTPTSPKPTSPKPAPANYSATTSSNQAVSHSATEVEAKQITCLSSASATGSASNGQASASATASASCR